MFSTDLEVPFLVVEDGLPSWYLIVLLKHLAAVH